MKTKVIALFFMVSKFVFAQNFTPNTAFLNVANFYYINEKGEYDEYTIHGFYENNITAGEQKLFLLPYIHIELEKIAYFDEEGNEINYIHSSEIGDIKSIEIPITYRHESPNEQQSAGIGSALLGNKVTSFVPPLLKNQYGRPFIYQPAFSNPQLVSVIEQYYLRDEQETQRSMQAAKDKYKSYHSQLSPIQGFRVEIKVDNYTVSSQEYPGTVIPGDNTALSLVVSNLTIPIVNKIRSGNFNAIIYYRMLDSAMRSIDANFDFERIISNYVKETQKVITREKSMGFKVFGIGYRKSSISQDVNYQIDTKLSDKKYANTTIVMDNADDDMVNQLDYIFFKEFNKKQEAIDAHTIAAETADREGNAKLAQLHRDYAEALRKGDENKEMDLVAAAAALSTQNYAAFIANGVRAQYSDTKGEYIYSRIIAQDFTQEDKKYFMSNKHVPVLRECTYFLPKKTDESKISGYLGIADLTQMSTIDMFGNQKNFIFILGVRSGSPAAAAGLLPGMLILSMNGMMLSSVLDMTRIASKIKAGDLVTLGYQDPLGNLRMISLYAAIGPRKP